MIRLLFFILSFFTIISCNEREKAKKNETSNSSIEKISNKQLKNISEDTLQIIFSSLKNNGFNIDTSFHLNSDTYLSDIICMILENQNMDIKSCECTDSVKIFKIKKSNFEHKNKEDYFSYPAKDYDIDIWINVWYFSSNKKAHKCLNNNKVAFFTTYNMPQKSYVFSDNILSVSPASLKETSLYKEIISIIDSTIIH